MWPFKKKEKTPVVQTMFDMEAIKEMESLTPEQIVRLVCASIGVSAENAVIFTLHESCTPLTKQVVR